MQDYAYLTVGTDRLSWQLPNGSAQIAGITIDNPSGSWLFIPQDGTFIPPYTIGFAHSFFPTVMRVDILFQDGPSGQVSTLNGDRPYVIIYDTPVGSSAGTPAPGTTFVSQRHQPEIIAIGPITLDAAPGVTITNLLNGATDKRLRIYWVWVVGTAGSFDGEAYITVRSDTTFIDLPEMHINRNRPKDRIIFTDPPQLPLGEELEIGAGFTNPLGDTVEVGGAAAVV